MTDNAAISASFDVDDDSYEEEDAEAEAIQKTHVS